MGSQMQSRKEAEQAVNDALRGVTSLFKILSFVKDSDREKMIRNLDKASEASPDYKTAQIKSMLKNLYFNRVKDNFNTHDFDVALNCGKKYLALYDAAAPKDKFQEQIVEIMVTMREMYYQLTKHDFSKNEFAKSLNNAKKYLEIYDVRLGEDEPAKKHELQGIMLRINQERVKAAKHNGRVFQIPNVPATNIYQSMPVKIIPRTPTPLKVTQSMNTKFARVKKPFNSCSAAPTTHTPKMK